MDESFPFQEGRVIADKYRLLRVLGAGGMGIVVEATHLELMEQVAIKLLKESALGSSSAVERFIREARASARIKSEYVARTFDVGRLESGVPYLVMELLKGQDLARRLSESGPLSIRSAADFLLCAAEALAQAHAIGIVHRDIKPSNLFVVERTDGSETIKVLDFGVSKVSGAAGIGFEASITTTLSVIGSPRYMSPEQWISSRDVDDRADIWAIGVTLYELLTGKPPFFGDSAPELQARVLGQPTPAMRALRPSVPEPLDLLVQHCLAKDPRERVPNVAQFADELKPFASPELQPLADRIARILKSKKQGQTAASIETTLEAARGAPDTARAGGQIPFPERVREELEDTGEKAAMSASRAQPQSASRIWKFALATLVAVTGLFILLSSRFSLPSQQAPRKYSVLPSGGAPIASQRFEQARDSPETPAPPTADLPRPSPTAPPPMPRHGQSHRRQVRTSLQSNTEGTSSGAIATTAVRDNVNQKPPNAGVGGFALPPFGGRK